MACKKSGFRSYRPLDGPLKRQGSFTAAATISQEIKRVIPQMCAIHRHILSRSTRYLAVNATPVGCTKY